jgi:hypothetical protein
MINRRFMILPPALPSGGHAEQVEQTSEDFSRLLLETNKQNVLKWGNIRSGDALTSMGRAGDSRITPEGHVNCDIAQVLQGTRRRTPEFVTTKEHLASASRSPHWCVDCVDEVRETGPHRNVRRARPSRSTDRLVRGFCEHQSTEPAAHTLHE